MSDTDKTSFATAGSGKSDAEVAFELVSKLKGQGVWGERNLTAILDMYAECLDAVKGLRTYEGQSRVDLPARSSASQTVRREQVQTQPIQEQPAQAQRVQQQPQAHMQAQPAQGQQPVRTQQQALQQAFKQG